MKRLIDQALRHFSVEDAARKFVLDRLGVHFDFYQEVGAADRVTGQKYRFDAVSVCESTGYLLGWEFKRSHLLKKEFGKALKQAADYREAVITDAKLSSLHGKQVEACIVFPDWDGLHASGRMDNAKEADGMRLMASYFRVGTLAHRMPTDDLRIIVGEQPIWHSTTGWNGLAEGVLRGKRPRGATKSYDLTS